MSSFLRRKLALMLSTLSTSFKEWFGYPLICNGSSAGYLTDYKLYGNTEQKYITVDGVQYKVPDGYTVLDYIQSTGTQYIDTGINPASKKIGMILDFQLTSVTSNDQISGSFGSDGVDNFQWSEFSSGTVKWRWKLGTAGGYGDTCDTNRHTVYFNTPTGVTLDTTSLTTTQYTIPSTNTNTIWLGARNSGTPQPCKAKFYSAKYYDYTSDSNGELLRCFVPMKNSSNVVGMYDFVSNTFFTNAGSGTFTAGNEAPCPTQPLDILSVGDKTNNLWDKSKSTTKWINSTGKEVDYPNGQAQMSDYVECSPGDTFTICGFYNGTTQSYTQMEIAWYNSSKTFLSRGTTAGGTQTSFTATAPSDTAYCKFGLYNQADTTVINHNPMAVSGSTTPTSYVGYGYAIPVVSSGLNLFDKTAITSGGYLDNTGAFVSSTFWSVSDYMPVTGGETYYQTLRTAGTATKTCWYDKDKTFISLSNQVAGGTQTAPSDACYCRMSVFCHSTTSDLNTAMFTYGSTAPTSYVAYVTPVTTDIYLPQQLRAVSTYKDYIDYGNQNVVSNIGVKVFDGTENWAEYARISNCYYIGIEEAKASQGTNILCTHYPAKAQGTDGGVYCGATNIGSVQCGAFYFTDSDYSDVTAWQAFVTAQYSAGTPITIYYPLATETTTSTTLPQLPTFATYTKITTTTTVKPSNAYGKQ